MKVETCFVTLEEIAQSRRDVELLINAIKLADKAANILKSSDEAEEYCKLLKRLKKCSNFMETGIVDNY